MEAQKMNPIAEDFVKVALEIGLYDSDYIDAYYGPEEWKPNENVKEDSIPTAKILEKLNALLDQLNTIDESSLEKIEKQRKIFINKNLIAARAKVEMISGKKYTFDEESSLLYDAVLPSFETEYFDSLLENLDKALPGKGTLAERYEGFKKDYYVPADKLDTVFTVAINECRKRTLKYIDLPKKENFVVEYVTDKVWGGYNWYKGNSHSLIQVNTDLPSRVSRAINLAAHEGYPGHHVFNALLENELYKKRGWVEFTVYPLFSPQSFIAEGSANYAEELVFPREEKIKFEQDVLYPLAGLDPSKVEKYYDIIDLVGDLKYAGNMSGRDYLDGKMSLEEFQAWSIKYSLSSPERAKKSNGFVEKYRSYIINYTVGQDIIEAYIRDNGDGTIEKKWELFEKILSTPITASMLKGDI